MDFYLEDDDEDVIDPSQAQEFLCPNCGSSDSYTDNAGTLFCSQCFSRSQTQQNVTELEYEDVQALVARGHRGRLMAARYCRGRRSSVGVRKGARKPMHTHDRSKPLPSLDECLRGYTTVIQANLAAVFPLLNLDVKHQTVITDAVRHMWLQYLKSWQEGAEFYRSVHPEVRISLRDTFISFVRQRELINNFLTNQAILSVKKKMRRQEKEKETIEEESEEEKEKSDNEEKDDEGDEQQDGKSLEYDQDAPGPKTGGFAVLSSTVDLYKRKGRREAALKLYPNMSMVASLLLSVLCKFGVTASHLAKWIACGKLPLLNAFKSSFDSDLQFKLGQIKYAFRMDRVPTAQLIEFQAKLLCTAASQDPKLITPSSIPLLTARLVADLHLGPGILNSALSLMGEKPLVAMKSQGTEHWLPTQLIRNVESRVHILGAIAVACKLTPGWEMRKVYHRPDEADFPWNEDQAPLVAQQSSTLNYVDFVNHHILDGRRRDINPEGKKLVPEFLMYLDDQKPKAVATETTTERVRPILLAGGPNPNQPPSRKRLQKHHAWFLRLKKRKATWADANGVEGYVAYDEPRSQLKNCHAHYQLLLEHMAFVADVKAQNIHYVVREVDREILFRCRPNLRDRRAIVRTTFKKIPGKTKRRIDVPIVPLDVPFGDPSCVVTSSNVKTRSDSSDDDSSTSSSGTSSDSDDEGDDDDELDLLQALI